MDAEYQLSALDAFIHNCPDSQDKTNDLKALLADITLLSESPIPTTNSSEPC